MSLPRGIRTQDLSLCLLDMENEEEGRAQARRHGGSGPHEAQNGAGGGGGQQWVSAVHDGNQPAPWSNLNYHPQPYPPSVVYTGPHNPHQQPIPPSQQQAPSTSSIFPPQSSSFYSTSPVSPYLSAPPLQYPIPTTSRGYSQGPGPSEPPPTHGEALQRNPLQPPPPTSSPRMWNINTLGIGENAVSSSMMSSQCALSSLVTLRLTVQIFPGPPDQL